MSRVLVLGLDGATFDVLEPLIAEGRLPALSRLIKQGTKGRLETIFPPVTAPAWASFMTGKNPGKHGIYEFLYRQPGTRQHLPVSARLLGAEPLWNILSRHDRSVGVINVPLTYPHQRVKGYMLGDFLTPPGADDYAYPRVLIDEVEERHGKYILFHRQVYSPGKVDDVLNELYQLQEQHANVALDLLRRTEWEFFMIHFAGIDRLQHELWHVFDSTHPQYDEKEASQYKERTLQFYETVDRDVQRLIDAAGDDTYVIAMSDHGFGPISSFVNMNVWLVENGFLKIKRDVVSQMRYRLFKLGLTPAVLYKLAMKIGMANIRLTRGMTKRGTLIQLAEKVFLSLSDIDWEQSKAYSQGNYGQIYLNLDGREPNGSVAYSDAWQVRAEIIDKLRDLKDPQTGQPIIEQIHRRDQIYSGDHSESAPDVVFLLRSGYKALGTLAFTSNEVIGDAFGNSGDHRMDGILIMTGPDIKQAHSIQGAKIVDLAPTILYLMGVPIDQDMDGAILKDAIDESYQEDHMAQFEAGLGSHLTPADAAYSPAEAAQIRERLMNLGYWD